MSDINVLPGIGLILISLSLVVFSALFMLIFLLVAAFTQKQLPYRRRLAFFLFVGMWPPFVLGWMGILLAEFASLSLRTSLDREPVSALIAAFLMFLSLGAWWGVWCYRRRLR